MYFLIPETKKTFSPVTSLHIYSVQKCRLKVRCILCLYFYKTYNTIWVILLLSKRFLGGGVRNAWRGGRRKRGGGVPDSWFPMGIPQSEWGVLEKQKLERGTTISFCGCGFHDSKTTNWPILIILITINVLHLRSCTVALPDFYFHWSKLSSSFICF